MVSLCCVTHSWMRRKRAIASGRSKRVQTLRTSEGARLRIKRRLGILMPMLRSAARIRSLDSLTAASGSPMMSMLGSDLELSASIVMGYHSSPSEA